MTYHTDPTRWTQSPEDAPEVLRGAFGAASREGPSDLQMRTLALKLAAVGSGAALAAGAGTAQASATAGGGIGAGALAASGGSAFTLTKIAVSLALLGAAATGTVLWQRSAGPRAELNAPLTQQAATAVEAAAEEVADKPEALARGGAPNQASGQARGSLAQAPSLPAVTDPTAPATQENQATQASKPLAVETATPLAKSAAPQATSDNDRAARRAERRGRRAANQASREEAVASPARSSNLDIEQVAGHPQRVSEIELLRSARLALSARPRDTYRLTEQHRDLYPQGVFAQERDALAVEALLRAGDLKLARELAEAFVQRYPSSPHAHRFRESMNLK